MTKTGNWLAGLGLEQYAEVFAENDVDLDIAAELTDEDLKELGLSLGHRRKFLRAAAKLQMENSVQEAAADTTGMLSGGSIRAAQAEKRFMSLMFCDLADSTAIAAELDVEDMHGLNRAYQDACSRVIQRHGGYVAKYMGDGILAYFGFPTAAETDAEHAIDAGLEIITRMREMRADFSLPKALSLRVRIGISTGRVVVESVGNENVRENAVVGEAPNIAARLQRHADANSILIGPETERLVKHAFDLEDKGLKEIKGYQAPIRAWEVKAALPMENRRKARIDKHLTPLIGRDEEFSRIKSRWERSKAGSGQVVLLSGEAGIGKTRLVESLLDDIDSDHHRIRLFCTPLNAQNPLHPFVTLLLRESGASPTDSVQVRKEKLSTHLTDVYKLEYELRHFLLALAFVDSSAEQKSQSGLQDNLMALLQTRMVDVMLGLAEQKPVLLLVEDAHWIDPSTQNVIDRIAEKIHSSSFMLMVSFRREKQIQYSMSNVTSLTLNNLSSEQSSRLVESITRASDLPDEVVRQISEKTGGIPLFLEEVSKSFLGGHGEEDLSALESHSIPDTLQASLLSTLDRLGDSKLFAQAGSVIGSAFDTDTLKNILQTSDGALRSGLKALIDQQITVRDSTEQDYLHRFRHALLRDAAYESILKKNRMRLHGQIASYIEDSKYKEERSNQTLIAYHYEMAGMPDQAFNSWCLAGASALQSGATAEASELFEKAGELLPKVSGEVVTQEDIYDFHMHRGQALNATLGAAAGDAHESFKSAAAIAKELESIEKQVDALDYLFGITFNAGNIRSSLVFAEQMLELGERHQSPVATVSGYQGLGMAHCTLCELESARHSLTASLGYADQKIEGINCFPSMTLDYLSYVEYFLGDNDAAKTHCEQAIDSAVNESEYATAVALSNSCFTQMMLGDYLKAQEYSNRALALALERGQMMVFNRALLFNNLANAWLDKDPTYLKEVVNATDALYQSQEFVDLTYLIGMTAELQIHFGFHEQAATALDRALQISAQTEENFYKPELMRLAALLSSIGEDDAQEQETYSVLIEEARSLAEGQNAQGWIAKISRTAEEVQVKQ